VADLIGSDHQLGEHAAVGVQDRSRMGITVGVNTDDVVDGAF
jgi:hypothetical protein